MAVDKHCAAHPRYLTLCLYLSTVQKAEVSGAPSVGAAPAAARWRGPKPECVLTHKRKILQ